MCNYVTLSKDPLFFSNAYNYYIRGGYWCILVENILNIILTAFTLVFVTFVCFFLNWDAISKCESVETCKDMTSYIISPTNFHPTGVNVCMFLFIVMFFIYWLWISVTMIKDIIEYIKYKKFFCEDLGIGTDEIKVFSWNDVVNKMIYNDDSLTTEIIIGSIMKRDNYLISIVSSNIFRIKPYYYTHSLLWLINIGLLNQIFIYGSSNKGKYIADYNRIKRVMKILGILQIVFLPFTLSILLIHYIVSFTTDIYTKKSYVGPKEWTLYAKLLFREYNELPHIFNDRITKSYKYASKYEQKFNSHMMNIVMDKIIFILGTYLTLLVIMTLYDERIVMYMRLFNRNLLWYVAIITSCISLAKLMMVYPSAIDETAEEIMQEIVKHTHYFPNKWKTGNQYEVLNDFRVLYKYKLLSMFIEVLSVFVIPFYIIFKLSDDIEVISKFIERNTIRHEKLGYVCKMGIVGSNECVVTETIPVDDDITVLLIDDDKYEKMERSTQNFLKYYKEIPKTMELQGFNVTQSEIERKIRQTDFS